MTDKLVDRLRTVALYESHGEESDLPEQAADALEAQQARIRELEDALRPFAAEAENHQHSDDDDPFEGWDGNRAVFKVADTRRAKKVLGGGE